MELLSVTGVLLSILGILLVRLLIYGFTRPDPYRGSGVPRQEGVLPFVGNIWGMWKENMEEEDTKLREKYGKVRKGGLYLLTEIKIDFTQRLSVEALA